LAYEPGKKAWRGLTEDGDIIVVQGVPDKINFANKTLHINERIFHVPDHPGLLNEYMKHYRRAVRLYQTNENVGALEEIDTALSIAKTAVARLHRGFILLALNRWPEGFAEYREAETYRIYMRPMYERAIKAGIKPWRGENIAGKKLLVMHDHGYGDSIMMLRYMPMLRRMGIDVTMYMPKILVRLAAQHGHVTSFITSSSDYCCSILMLLGLLRQRPGTIPLSPYLKVYSELANKWRGRVQNGGRRKIGIAWTVGKVLITDFPRSIPLKMLVRELRKDGDLFSVQQQASDEANALGVRNFEFEDFADCAALMSQLDEIVTVDTAAVHLAGAIGHPQITLLLSHWASWRWLSPCYENVTVCRQDKPKDWASALAKRKCATGSKSAPI
jgi:hypothetical protein